LELICPLFGLLVIAFQALHVPIEFGILLLYSLYTCERVFVAGYFVSEVAVGLFDFTL